MRPRERISKKNYLLQKYTQSLMLAFTKKGWLKSKRTLWNRLGRKESRPAFMRRFENNLPFKDDISIRGEFLFKLD